MRLRFHSSLKDTMFFAQTTQKDFEKKVVPKWFNILAYTILVSGLGGIAYQLFPQADRVIALYILLGLFLWLWVKAYKFCYVYLLDRVLSETKDYDAWTVEVEGA